MNIAGIVNAALPTCPGMSCYVCPVCVISFHCENDKFVLLWSTWMDAKSQRMLKGLLKQVEGCLVSHNPLLLGHWYEIMALYYVKSILTEISAS